RSSSCCRRTVLLTKFVQRVVRLRVQERVAIGRSDAINVQFVDAALSESLGREGDSPVVIRDRYALNRQRLAVDLGRAVGAPIVVGIGLERQVRDGSVWSSVPR